MIILIDLATKEVLDVVDLKTLPIITYLQDNNIYLDSHRYDEMTTAEVGFFPAFTKELPTALFFMNSSRSIFKIFKKKNH